MERVVSRAMNALMAVLGSVLIAMVGLSVWNVVARYVFNSALLWADEVAVFAMIVMSWLGAIVVSWRGAEISMNLLIAPLPHPLQKTVQICQHLLVSIVCGWVAWLSWNYVERVFRFGMTSDAAKVPLWTVHGTITLSLVLMSAIALWRVVGLLSFSAAGAPHALKTEETPS